ncbi:MAG: histidine kinase, partial [Gemmatimonadota bacterium]
GTKWFALGGVGTPRLTRLRKGDYRSVGPPDERPSASLSNSIVEDGRGYVWVNDLTAPYLYQMANDSIAWRAALTESPAARAEEIVAEGGDTLWFATRQNLYRVIGRAVTRVALSEMPPLMRPGSVNMVVHDGHLWIATGGGVTRTSLAALHAYADGRGPEPTMRSFSAADGLRIGRLTFANKFAVFAARDGRLWFSTPGGLAVYDRSYDRVNGVAPFAHTEEVVADGRRLRDVGSGIVIPPRTDRVEIHVSAPSIRIPERVRIEYLLDGVDHTWVKAGPERIATYTRLKPGRFLFHVRAWNEDGVPSVREATLSLGVMPMWYQTTVFRGLVLLLVVGGGPLVVYAVVQQRAKHREVELHARFDAALDERTRVARELHDTLLQGFGGVTLQLQAVQHSLGDSPQTISDRLSRILTIADATMRDARHAIWDMRAPELGDHNLPGALEGVARTAIDGSSVKLSFAVQGRPRRLSPLIESTVFRVGREAIVNALRHGKPSDIAVELVYSDDRVEFHVRDDGTGFDDRAESEARATGHWGLSGMRERARLAGGSLEINGVAGRGTTVSLWLPIRSAVDDKTARKKTN